MKKLIFAALILASGFISGCGSNPTTETQPNTTYFDTVSVTATLDPVLYQADSTYLGALTSFYNTDSSYVVETDKNIITVTPEYFYKSDVQIPVGSKVELYTGKGATWIYISWFDADKNVFGGCTIIGTIEIKEVEQ